MSQAEPTNVPKRPRRRNRTLLPVAAATTVAFLGLTGFLGAQMAEGKDPLVGSGKQATAQVKPTTVRKVIITRKVIIRKEAPAVSPGGAAGVPASGAPASGGSYSAPVQQSAPVQSAPAPAPAAPAPVQSGSS